MALGRLLFLWILSLVGSALAIWTLIIGSNLRFGRAGQSMCNMTEQVNCEAVLQTQWAYFLGFPLGVWAVFFYVSIIILSWHSYSRPKSEARFGWGDVVLLLSFTGLVSSIALFLVSHFQIGVLCPICLLMYIVNILLFLVTLFAERSRSFPTRMLNAPGFLFRSVFTKPRAATILALELAVAACIALFIARAIDGYQEHMIFDDMVAEFMKQPQFDIPEAITEGQGVDFVVGPQDAPIRLVEFFDYQCPACRDMFDTIEQLREEFPDALQVEFRNYPLDHACNPSIQQPYHQAACESALLARCAGLQGRFQIAHTYLMTTPELEDDISLAEFRQSFPEVWTELNLEPAQMEACMNSKAQRRQVLRDIALGDALRIQGTPSLWMNGRFLSHPGEDTLRLLINYHLQNDIE